MINNKSLNNEQASQVAQWRRTHLPMQETQVKSLGREDLLEVEGVSLPGKSHGQRSLEGYSPLGRKRVRHDLVAKQ